MILSLPVGTDRSNLRGAAKRAALKADATRYLRAIVASEAGQNLTPF